MTKYKESVNAIDIKHRRISDLRQNGATLGCKLDHFITIKIPSHLKWSAYFAKTNSIGIAQ